MSQILWCFYRLWRGRYKRPLTSRDFIGLWKEKRYRRNMMFLFAGHSDKPLKSLIFIAHEGNHICLHRFSFIYVMNDLWEDAYTCPVNVMNCTSESANLRYGTHGYEMSAYEITAKFKRFNALWFVDVKGHTSRSFIFGFCRSYSGLTDFHNLDIACHTVLA